MSSVGWHELVETLSPEKKPLMDYLRGEKPRQDMIATANNNVRAAHSYKDNLKKVKR